MSERPARPDEPPLEERRDRVALLLEHHPDLRLLPIGDVARVTGLSFQQVKALVEAGEIASVRIGEDHRVPVAAIRRYYEDLVSGHAGDRLPTRRAPEPVGRRVGRRPARA